MIDDNELQIKIRSLHVLVYELQEAQTRAGVTLSALQSIKLVDGNKPADSTTGQMITEARRTEIYNACAPEADKLIAQSTKVLDPPDES